jgi:hypothetical protein
MFATAIIHGVVRLPDTTAAQIRFHVDEGVMLPDGTVEWTPVMLEASVGAWPGKTPSSYRLRVTSDRAASGRPWLIRIGTTTPRGEGGSTEARVPFTRCHEPSDSSRVDLTLRRH